MANLSRTTSLLCTRRCDSISYGHAVVCAPYHVSQPHSASLGASHFGHSSWSCEVAVLDFLGDLGRIIVENDVVFHSPASVHYDEAVLVLPPNFLKELGRVSSMVSSLLTHDRIGHYEGVQSSQTQPHASLLWRGHKVLLSVG